MNETSWCVHYATTTWFYSCFLGAGLHTVDMTSELGYAELLVGITRKIAISTESVVREESDAVLLAVFQTDELRIASLVASGNTSRDRITSRQMIMVSQ